MASVTWKHRFSFDISTRMTDLRIPDAVDMSSRRDFKPRFVYRCFTLGTLKNQVALSKKSQVLYWGLSVSVLVAPLTKLGAMLTRNRIALGPIIVASYKTNLFQSSYITYYPQQYEKCHDIPYETIITTQ